MLKKIAISMFILLAASVGGMANQQDAYISAQYQLGTYDQTNVGELNTSGITLILGKKLWNKVSLEGRHTLGTDGKTKTLAGATRKVTVDNQLSLLMRVDQKVSDTLNIYGLLGITKIKLKAENNSVLTSSTDDSLSYGFGAELKLNDAFWASTEYIMYLVESSYDYSSINVGIKYLFEIK